MARGFRASFPFNVPMRLMVPTETSVKGVTKQVFPNVEDCPLFFGAFRTFGGTETTVNNVYTVEDTGVIDTGLTDAAKKVATDTIAALAPGNLPAKGKYRTGRTEESAIAESEIRVEWSGPIAEVGLGFDKSKPGAGGFLINGTPRMAPDRALQRIYARKTYSNELVKDMANLLIKEIVKLMN